MKYYLNIVVTLIVAWAVGVRLMAHNVFGLCVRFCLAQSQMFSTNVDGKTCTKPVLCVVAV